ncbi:MAG: terminase family protein [Puniceicoccales bacterium]|jgi:phage FluMu gp28-like protein|nr:terminase family protein [Puniceicoccales bacterium]
MHFEGKFFLPYQKRWINDTSRLKIIEKSRQIGISLATAYRLVREHACKGCRFDAWVSSRDEIQAKLFLEDCKKFSQILHIAAQDMGYELLGSDKKSGSISFQFSNNRSIHSLSSNPDAQAGKRGTRVLDEFALHPNPKLLYAVAYPGITWGGQLEIISTHRGSDNFFYKLIQDITENGNPKNFSHHRVTLQDALEQGFLQKLKAKVPENDPIREMDEADYFDYIRRSCADRETFLQEYMCEPYDDQSLFLPTNLVEDAEKGYDPRKVTAESDLFLGVDVGRTSDLTVFWLIASVGEVLVTKDVIVLKNKPFSEQEAEFYKLLSLPLLRRACIDQTGIGRQFTERAMERFGRYRVEGITFTGSTKEQLAYLLRMAFEDRVIRIPSDEHIRTDLRSVKRENTFAGNVRFSAERTREGHGDRFWALALALHAAQNFRSKGETHFINLSRKERLRRLKHPCLSIVSVGV